LKGLFGLIGIDFYPTNMPPKSSQWNPVALHSIRGFAT
jgi:hypothetical protein